MKKPTLKQIKAKANKAAKALLKELKANKIATLNLLVTLVVLSRVELVLSKFAVLQDILGTIYVNVMVNMIMFGGEIQRIVEIFTGEGA